MLQLDRPAHQLFAVWGRLVVLYQDGSLGLTDRLLHETNCAASLPFIVWSQILIAGDSACIAVVFRDKVWFVFHCSCHLSSVLNICVTMLYYYLYLFDGISMKGVKCGGRPKKTVKKVRLQKNAARLNNYAGHY